MKYLETLKTNHSKIEQKIGKIPFTVDINSELYGTYTMVLVTIEVNINEGIFPSKELFDNLDSGTRTTRMLQDFSESFLTNMKKAGLGHIKESLGGAVMGTYIPLEVFNENWKVENLDCKYLAQCPRVKKLPIIQKTEKQMVRFLEKNNELINLLIEKI